MAPALAAAIPFLGQLLERILPDPRASDAAKLELMKLAQSGELAALSAETELAKGQMAINQVEAASNRLFVAGWRPFVGWMCGLAFGFKFIGGPLLQMLGQVAGVAVQLPAIDATELTPILVAMLGLGGLRTVEKIKGAG